MGYRFNVGPECEFFPSIPMSMATRQRIPNDAAGYFDMGPSDVGESCRRDICLTLEDMGFEIGGFPPRMCGCPA